MRDVAFSTDRAPSRAWGEFVKSVSDDAYHFIGCEEFCTHFRADSAEWDEFSACWDGLTQDLYMNDQGLYRYRRYGEFLFLISERQLVQLPHGPYHQPEYINNLNGGVMRNFDPLDHVFVKNGFFKGLMEDLSLMFGAVEGGVEKWNIKLHPYRIRAAVGMQGRPTPEGVHRDGVDYIAVLMIRRKNIIGGETCVTTNDGVPLRALTLARPKDMLVFDDRRVMHGVSPIECVADSCDAYRDVLVVAFTRC
ncbi:2OG-Fe dioxygenase family protein [Pseudothauera rhizosphaerae]|uniref:2OG-Fe dioxygenase family protein n=1 Tax=Pseudothauera rhizosphaerae TaxID=2565932 RepID=A0A4S4AB98_9RHOO|nr:2OG-Fe dioxygenase family protein [Pseudothauera rhizosphaerae]THF56237.1 hypothetical protein E6O51_19790 [Pseudothauera rhizosphaerae]